MSLDMAIGRPAVFVGSIDVAQMLTPDSLQPISYADPRTGSARRPVSAMALLAVVAGGLLLATVVGVVLTTLIVAEVRLPDLVLWFAPGLAVGLGVAWMIRRANVRHRGAALMLAGVSGAATIVVVVLSLYAAAVLQFSSDLRQYLANQNWSESAIDAAVASPFSLYDRAVLLPAQGRGGPIGFAANMTVEAKSALTVAGLASVFIAMLSVRTVAGPKGLYCELCHDSFDGPTVLAVLPFGWEQDIVQAIESDDVDRMRELRRSSYGGDFGVACTSVNRYRCPGCSKVLVDVTITNGGESIYRSALDVSEEMLEALKPPPEESLASTDVSASPGLSSGSHLFRVSDASGGYSGDVDRRD